MVHTVLQFVNGGLLKGPGIKQIKLSVHLDVFHPLVHPFKPFIQLKLKIQSRSKGVQLMCVLLLRRALVG